MSEEPGRVAVITGAGSGLGRAFAERAAALGMRLVLADVEAAALEATRAALAGCPAAPEVLAMTVDVSRAAQVEALAEAAMSRFGAVHLLFNNAGVAVGGLLWENSLEDWQWTLGVNLWGVIHGVRAFVPRMLALARDAAHYRGHIVNTASMAGLVNVPCSGVYNASKHAVVSISETLYHDLSLVTRQVSCSVLCPYFIATGIGRADRNRPQALDAGTSPSPSQRAIRALNDKALASSKVSAAQVADRTFEALQRGDFYIYSHPQALGGVRVRMEDLLAARNPTDPFLERPQLRRQLEDALRG